MDKIVIASIAVTLSGALLLFLLLRKKIARFRMVITLFTGAEQHKNDAGADLVSGLDGHWLHPA